MADAPGTPLVAPGSAKWCCPACTMDNEVGVTVCVMCGTMTERAPAVDGEATQVATGSLSPLCTSPPHLSQVPFLLLLPPRTSHGL
jgi:hypothetical protein